jgi:hypothetical protein
VFPNRFHSWTAHRKHLLPSDRTAGRLRLDPERIGKAFGVGFSPACNLAVSRGRMVERAHANAARALLKGPIHSVQDSEFSCVHGHFCGGDGEYCEQTAPDLAGSAMPTSPSFPPASFGAARVEHDLLGDLTVPAAAYYGVQTVRALDNFQITGIPLSHFPQFARALAMVKKAAARVNRKLGLLPERCRPRAAALRSSCWRKACSAPPNSRTFCGRKT